MKSGGPRPPSLPSLNPTKISKINLINLDFDFPILTSNTISEGTSLVIPYWDTTSFVTTPDPLLSNGTQHTPNTFTSQNWQ